MRGIGRSFNAFLARSSAFRRAVAALGALGRRAVNLDQHGIVEIPFFKSGTDGRLSAFGSVGLSCSDILQPKFHHLSRDAKYFS